MAEVGTPSTIRVDPVTPEAQRLWSTALELAEALGAERQWSLIGGLMVQLHAHEHDDDLRPTADIDLLGAARKPPAMTEQIAALLAEKGGEVAMPPRSAPGLGYRFELDGDIVEVLGPDGSKSDPKTLPGLRIPRGLASDGQLTSSEKRWLRDVEELLDFGDADVAALFPAAVLERAQQAFRLLSA